jgi:hypothetical protein
MADPIDLLVQGRAHELSPGFAVRRVLPSVKRRMVGPFIFFDHFGPMVVPPGGEGMDVRPHPHIGLATVTYLFDGGIFRCGSNSVRQTSVEKLAFSMDVFRLLPPPCGSNRSISGEQAGSNNGKASH